jgi:hypothetical protein
VPKEVPTEKNSGGPHLQDLENPRAMEVGDVSTREEFCDVRMVGHVLEGRGDERSDFGRERAVRHGHPSPVDQPVYLSEAHFEKEKCSFFSLYLYGMIKSG